MSCSYPRKLQYSHAQAHVAVEDMRPTDPRHDLLEVFPCPRGIPVELAEHWHIGHRDPGGRTQPWHRPLREPPPLTQRLELPEHLRALTGEAS